MGHYCRICGGERSNEQFSGKGHRIHMCKRCKAKPKSERQAIEDKDDILGFMHQSHISEKNVARLVQMAKSENPQVANLAAIVLEVARVKPLQDQKTQIPCAEASVTAAQVGGHGPGSCPHLGLGDYGSPRPSEFGRNRNLYPKGLGGNQLVRRR
jgi:hypothetical protein